MNAETLRTAILEKLTSVIDPETGADVVHMRLVLNLVVNEDGKAAYIFRPSSPLCPIAVPLALAIIQAVSEVPGITGQDLQVIDYVQADVLNEILKSVL
jgi:metal-sulfur cluster biosynthetic enzyme